MPMSRLSDYLRAEVPDETEPASFYVPGAHDWREAKIKNRTNKGGADENELSPEQPLDTTDTSDIDELAAAQTAAALEALKD